MRHLLSSHRRLNQRQLAEPSRRCVNVHVHVVALVDATVFALPALSTRCFPHPLYQLWGGGCHRVPSTPTRRSVDVIGLVAAMVAVINLEGPTRLVTRLFPPTIIQRWGGLQRRL